MRFQADLAGPDQRTAANDCVRRRGVMRGAKGPPRPSGIPWVESVARHRCNARHLQRLGRRQRRQKLRQARGQHALATARRSHHQQTVAAGGGNQQRAFGMPMPDDIGQRDWLGGAAVASAHAAPIKVQPCARAATVPVPYRSAPVARPRRADPRRRKPRRSAAERDLVARFPRRHDQRVAAARAHAMPPGNRPPTGLSSPPRPSSPKHSKDRGGIAGTLTSSRSTAPTLWAGQSDRPAWTVPPARD